MWPALRRLFAGIYVVAEAEITFEVRSRAAHLLADGRGVLGGFSAAELLGASCAPSPLPPTVRDALRRAAQERGLRAV